MAEGEMALVYLIDDHINLDLYHLYKDLHIVDPTSLAKMTKDAFPKGFTAAPCALLATAKLYKTPDSQIILGTGD